MKARILGNKLLLLCCGMSLFLGVVFAEFDLSIAKNVDPGSPSTFHSGDVVRFILTGELSDGSSGNATEFLITDTLSPNMTFNGTWGVNPEYQAGPPFMEFQSAVSPLQWLIHNIWPTDLPLLLYYDVIVTGIWDFTNTWEITVWPTDPDDTNLTNNISVFTITVEPDTITGQCGNLTGLGLYDLEGDGDWFNAYKSDYPDGTGLCILGNDSATDEVYSGTGHVYFWKCRGENGGGNVDCQADELYCGDSTYAPTYGETCEDGNQAQGDGCSDTCEVELVRLKTVTPRTDTITIQNFWTTTVNISGFVLSSLWVTTWVEYLTIVTWSLSIPTSGSVTLSWFILDNNGGDLALFYATGSLSDSGTMIDFVQWWSGSNGTQTIAVAKNIWTTGTYIQNLDPYNYTGNGLQTGLAYWSSVAHVCGDNVIYTGNGETCDDGNTSNGDGCNASCTIETGWTCTGTPSGCSETNECLVGNGWCDDTCTNTTGSYMCSCDAGYILSGDAHSCGDLNECIGQWSGNNCSADATCGNTMGSFTCTCTSGFTWNGVTCNSTCGDGIIAGDEQCDDGWAISGDGCDATCHLETPSCSLVFSPTTGSVPLVVTWDEIVATWSSWIVYDELDWDDTTVVSSPIFPAMHTFTSAAQYEVTLTVSNLLSGNITNICTWVIQASTICGNNIVEVGEECDDGGTTSGDGCTALCQDEDSGWGGWGWWWGGGWGSNNNNNNDNNDNNDNTSQEHSSAPEIKRYTRAVVKLSILETIQKRFSYLQHILARNSGIHAAAEEEQVTESTPTPATVGIVSPLVDTEPLTDMFGHPWTTTVVPSNIPTPSIISAISAVPEIVEVPVELGDEQQMTPVPELGTWYKTGTPREVLIETLLKLKKNIN